MLNNVLFKNAIWLIFEKFISVLGTVFITIYTARYLGPESMGNINYSLALCTFIIPISQLGSGIQIFDRAARDRLKGARILISGQVLRTLIFIFLSIFTITYIAVWDSSGISIFVFFGILISSYFTSIDSYRPYFDGTLQSKVNVVATQFGLLSSQTLRLILIFISAPVYAFTVPYILNTIIPFIFRKNKFGNQNNALTVKPKLERKYRAATLITRGTIAISGFSVAISTQVNQVLLANYVGIKEVGFYGAAVLIAYGWLFLPSSIMAVVLSRVIKDKFKDEGYSFIFLICSIPSFLIVVLIFILNEDIILFTYGNEYLPAASLCALLSISSIFVVWGFVGNRIIIIQGGHGFVLKKSIFMAILSVVLSSYCVANYGVVGAAYSVIITEIISSTVANYFYQNGMIMKTHLSIFSSYKYYKSLI